MGSGSERNSFRPLPDSRLAFAGRVGTIGGVKSPRWRLTFLLLLLPLRLAADVTGWEYLIERLVADGLDRREVQRVFADPRVPAFGGLEFSARKPQEPGAMYRKFLQGPSVTAARGCFERHGPLLRRAEQRHGVPASVVASILHVETHCGRNTGNSVVLWRLARLAMANEPANVRRNLVRLRPIERDLPDLEARVAERARYLEDTFYPEVRAVFAVARQLGVRPLDLRGSVAGAFGFPQFLPTSFLAFGTDGNGDGRTDLHDMADAAESCARYLAGNGWRPGLSGRAQREVIWSYNRSESYIDTVLGLAARLRPGSVVHGTAGAPGAANGVRKPTAGAKAPGGGKPAAKAAAKPAAKSAPAGKKSVPPRS